MQLRYAYLAALAVAAYAYAGSAFVLSAWAPCPVPQLIVSCIVIQACIFMASHEPKGHPVVRCMPHASLVVAHVGALASMAYAARASRAELAH